jgi:hypothetical protein
MPFHRFVDPTYNLIGGSFPGTIGAQTYDRVNVISGGTGGGGAANADAAKVGGPNAGTYFVAFGEDATSSFANRGLRALAENTDFLDNVARGNIPGYSVNSSVAVSGTSFVLTGDVWTGDTLAAADDLVTLIDASTGRAPVQSNGQRLQVSGIYDNANAVNVLGNGWVTNPTVRLNASFTGNLNVAYGGRTSRARMLEETEQDRHWLMLMGAWARVFKNELIAWHGLNERYSRADSVNDQGGLLDVTPNTPGSGATIYRNGQALVLLHPNQDYWVSAPPDPYLALFRAEKVNTNLETEDRQKAGVIGFQSIYAKAIDPGEAGDEGSNLFDFVAMARRNVVSDTVGTGTAYTYVPVEAPCILNPGGTGDYTLQLTNASHYWSRNEGGTDVTGARGGGFDLALVTWGGVTRLLKLSQSIVGGGGYNQATFVSVNGPSGTGPFNGLNNEPATVTWITPHFWMGGQNDYPFFYGHAPYNSDDLDTEFFNPPFFLAGSRYESHGLPSPNGRVNQAFSWGGFDKRSGTAPDRRGIMYGDGSLECVRVAADLHSLAPIQDFINSSGDTATLDAYLQGTYAQSETGFNVHCNVNTGATGTGTINFNFYAGGLATMPLGTRCTVTLNVTVDTLDDLVLNWGGDIPFLFSGGEDQVPPDVVGVYKWEGLVTLVGSSVRTWLMTRTDYI